MTDNSQQSRDLASKDVAELLRATREAADFLAELYAKYSTKVGPFASQAQRINGVLQRAMDAVQQGETPERIPASERQPIPVTEIIDALQREGWVAAADGLKEVKDWETRTLMCRIDSRPSEVVGAVKAVERTP